jgi:hypothetical protein
MKSKWFDPTLGRPANSEARFFIAPILSASFTFATSALAPLTS